VDYFEWMNEWMSEWRTVAVMICTYKIFITGDPWSSKFIARIYTLWRLYRLKSSVSVEMTECELCVSQNLLFWCEICIVGGGHHIGSHDCRRQVTVILITFLKHSHKCINESVCVYVQYIANDQMYNFKLTVKHWDL
jgi:hypothetical protein